MFCLSAKPPRFFSPTMVSREQRARNMTNFSRVTQRDLERDRQLLDRHERRLLADVKRLVRKNDLHNARLVATQIAVYRRLVERNYESAIIIATKVQSISSNHKVNRAEVETIKSIKHANKGQTASSVEAHEWKYDQRMKLYESMEEIMTEGMDEVYHDVPLLFDPEEQPNYTVQQHIVDSIMKQAMSDKYHVREYFEFNQEPSKKKSYLNFQVVTNKYLCATLYVDTMDISVDMLKRSLIKDGDSLDQLELAEPPKHPYETVLRSARPFTLGRLVSNKDAAIDLEAEVFQPFPLPESLTNLGMQSGDTIWVYPKLCSGSP